MPPIPGMVHWHSLVARHAKSLRAAFNRAAQALEAQVSGRAEAKLQPLLARNVPRTPLHPLARIRQGQNRWYSTARRSLDHVARQFTTDAFGSSGRKFIDRSAFPKSRIGTYINQSSGRAPFASTLRPNLTGGALGRTAGGYTIGAGRGGARYFSHAPATQAQVVQNVSQAVRAFFISGQKAQFDGVSPRGEARFRAVTALQEETGRKVRSIPKATPGSWISFAVNPTITAFTPLSTVAGFESAASTAPADHLNTEGLLDVLSVDFSRVLKDLAATMQDLKRLAILGDLPISYEDSSLRVHFPGCDAETVERLCHELGITRGHVHQDALFDAFAGTEIALLFPFAPSKTPSEDSMNSYFDNAYWADKRPHNIDVRSLLTLSHSPAGSLISEPSGSSMEDIVAENPWLSSQSGYESVRSEHPSDSDPLEYQGFEGIYRFLEELDSVRRT